MSLYRTRKCSTDLILSGALPRSPSDALQRSSQQKGIADYWPTLREQPREQLPKPRRDQVEHSKLVGGVIRVTYEHTMYGRLLKEKTDALAEEMSVS
jgi:hypothetical protein